MQRTTIDFGIDLGTTNSTIAVIDDIDARVIPNKGGSGITPSAVWIDKRGNTRVGQEAKLRALLDDPDNAVVEFKLRMGLGAEGGKSFARSGRTMTPEEMSAEVLKELKADARTVTGEEIRAAVITVPAAFENPQTSATRRAAELAGLTLSPLLLEPVAASLAYGFQSESDNVYWFVYDFGGGTFDAAIMRIRDGLIQVVNHDGDNYLGGKLLDWDIVSKRLVPALTAEYNLPEFGRGRWQGPFGNLKWLAEQAKIEVCRTRAPYEIWKENLCTDADGKTVDFAYTLTPEDVKEISRPYIERSLEFCRKVLSGSGLTGRNMERVLMVGGSTLNPWIREAVEAEMGTRLEFGVDPVTVVARGAAIFASTQALPCDESVAVPVGTWQIEIEHRPVGNVPDPDIGGRVVSPSGQSLEGFTIEFIDVKTRWRSGKIRLGAKGVFMTQLYAEKQQRHEYMIELCDTIGTAIPTAPDRLSYTLGVIPEENPPAAWTIGVELANGSVATYLAKGTRLPFRKSMDHFSTVALRAGHPEDALRIPVLEGEHARAERNHEIGTMIIRGDQIRRDLPVGAQIEITMVMDKSQQIRVLAYVTMLDQEFEAVFDKHMGHSSLADMRKETERQKERLEKVRSTAGNTNCAAALEVIGQIDREHIISSVEDHLNAANNDPDAIAPLDRLLRMLAASIDAAEDAVEWPVQLGKAEESRSDAERVVEAYGDGNDRTRLATLTADLQRATAANDPDLLRRCIGNLDGLWYDVVQRQPGFHVGRFNNLTEHLGSMEDAARAEQLIAQGRRAIDTGDIDALKAANRQLLSMLPERVQVIVKRSSDVMTAG